MKHVAAGALRRVELLDQLPRANRARPDCPSASSTLFERGSATSETRCRDVGATRLRAAASALQALFSIATMSSADAYLTGHDRAARPAGGWSSDAMIRSMRRRLSA